MPTKPQRTNSNREGLLFSSLLHTMSSPRSYTNLDHDHQLVPVSPHSSRSMPALNPPPCTHSSNIFVPHPIHHSATRSLSISSTLPRRATSSSFSKTLHHGLWLLYATLIILLILTLTSLVVLYTHSALDLLHAAYLAGLVLIAHQLLIMQLHYHHRRGYMWLLVCAYVTAIAAVIITAILWMEVMPERWRSVASWSLMSAGTGVVWMCAMDALVEAPEE